MNLIGVETVEIKVPYKSIILRIGDNEAAYEMFYNEEDFKDFLEMLLRNGYPSTLQSLVDKSASSNWICFGCSIDFKGEL